VKALKILMLGSSIMLGSCATTGTSSTDLQAAIAAIRSATVAACSFLPTVSTVANLLTAGNPIAQSAESVAALICAAVQPVKQALRHGAKRGATAPPTVNGVVIHGRFL
jgi:hypothetical protein